MAGFSKQDVLIPLGRAATFYVPAHKMADPRYGRGGKTPTELCDHFFLTNFGGLTHEETRIRGKWSSADGQKVFTDLHERYVVSFKGEKQADRFLQFLSELCGQLEEDSIYLTMGTRSWLVKPTPPAAPSVAGE